MIFGGLAMAVRSFRMHNPSKFQVAIEGIFEFITVQVQDTLGETDRQAIALSSTIFLWILGMNAMDLLPVDLIPWIASCFGLHEWRSVPTADLSMNFGLSIGVTIILIQQGIQYKGLGHYLKEIFAHPYPWYFFVANLAFRLIEEFSRPVSLALRLYANIYAGELIFFLIALIPYVPQWPCYALWWGMHLVIITLQAYIFMVLSLAYLQGARAAH
jgi:F-type H+-transporting ATPase subunit a